MTSHGPIDNAGAGAGLEAWSSPAWREQAVAWLDRELAAAGIDRTGEVEQPNLRPWATVLRAPTSQGPVWLKAAGPGTAFEIGLYELLREVAPGHVLTPIAADLERSWLILPDGGQPLAEHLAGPDLINAIVTIMPRYGEMQRALAPHAERLLALGVPDMRPAILPARYEEALAAVAGYVDQRGGEDQRERYRQLRGFGQKYASSCAVLAALPGGASLDHSDLHPWNILVPAAGGIGQARIYDWGDSVVAHPFTSLLVTLRVLCYLLEVGPDHPAIVRVRDAYLEAFSDLATPAKLVATQQLACHLGKVTRCLSWARSLQGQTLDDEYAGAPFEWLTYLLTDTYLGEV